MSVRIFSASIQGIEAQLIEVEADSSPGLHVFHIVGLPDSAIKESKDRITSAIRNTGLTPPSSKNRKITINLAPADIRKEGPSYDLPIALGYLFETKQINFDTSNRLIVGELSLDGSLRKTNGVLAMAILAKELGFKEIIIPKENCPEASLVDEISTIGCGSLSEVIAHLNGTGPISPFKRTDSEKIADNLDHSPLLAIKGQKSAKRALVVAAAGFHNLIMSGAPGSGKTLLARALTSLLPPLNLSEAIEVAKIYSAVGLYNQNSPSFVRPFRNPHHTTSPAAIVGGGTHPKPGEISLAHRGILFFDEIPEFPRSVLESLRQPLEDGVVTVSRASGSARLPAKIMFIAAMNPCPCGNHGSLVSQCLCSPVQVLKYRKRVSGPLLDRIDIQLQVPRENADYSSKESTTLEELRGITTSIQKAHQLQKERFKEIKISSNTEMTYQTINKYCFLTTEAENLLSEVARAKHLSMRGYHKIIKVGRTVADLDSSKQIGLNHIAEAVSLRLEDKVFGEI